MRQTYIKGRGAQINTNNPFLYTLRDQNPLAPFEDDEDVNIRTKIIEANPKTVVNKVPSPDIGMEYSLNPYQGCEHGCVYCYARNTHTYWGYSAGLDFESKILVKKNAPELLRKRLSSKNWKCAPIVLSGNTDCYQPIEKKLEITRELLKIFWEFRHPVGIITKNQLILRDMDILEKLNELDLLSVAISINTLDDGLRRMLEPRTASIERRFFTVKKLADAGIPVTVMAAPIIPGLNDHDILGLVKKAAKMGARSVGHTIVRLNGDIAEIFTDWLRKNYPDRAEKVINKIASMHGGKLNNSNFGQRMSGEGAIADIIHKQFKLAKKLYLMDENPFRYNLNHYRERKNPQLCLPF